MNRFIKVIRSGLGDSATRIRPREPPATRVSRLTATTVSRNHARICGKREPRARTHADVTRQAAAQSPSQRIQGADLSTLTEGPAAQTSEELAEELHELEAHEAALERRTRSLELSGPLAMVFSFIALAFGIGALAIALTHNTDKRVVTMMRSVTPASSSSTSSSSSMPAAMNSTATAGSMMGVGGHGKFTPAQVAAAKRGAIYVQLGDIWAAPAVASVPAGKITFHAYNVGRLTHELMIERMPMKFDAPMQPNEDAAQGMIQDMPGGGHGRMTVRLKPGRYVLFCNVEGHYAAGQHIPFTVTKA